MNEIKIGWMYPNLLNLHGERGSIQALVNVGKEMGLSMQVARIEDFEDTIPFEDLDMLVFLPGEIAEFPHLMEGLRQQKQQLDSFIRDGGYVLAIGTTGLMFGNSILREDGSVMDCLGYLEMSAKERKYVWGDDLHMQINGSKMELIGSQIQMADVEAVHPFGTVRYGMGNNNSGAEGARENNLIYTNCLGPLFVKNPWFAEEILKDICRKKGTEISTALPHTLASDSMQSTLKFIENKPKK